MSNIVKLFLIALVSVLLLTIIIVFAVPSIRKKVFGNKDEVNVEEVAKNDEVATNKEKSPEKDKLDAVEKEAIKEIRQQEDEYMSSKQVKELGELLKGREEKILREEERIGRMRKVLEKERKHIAELKSNITKMHKDIAEFIPLITSGEKKNLKKMAKMFETLSVENANPIMERMNDQTLVVVLSMMKPRASAKLLGGYAAVNETNATRGALITEKLKKLVMK